MWWPSSRPHNGPGVPVAPKGADREAQDSSLILDEEAMAELSFGQEYMDSIAAKQMSQQEARRAQFSVEKAKQAQ